MAKRNVFQRIRAAFDGVVSSVENLFNRGRGETPPDVDLQPIQVPDIISPEPTEPQPVELRIEQSPEPYEFRDPYEDLTPEEIEDLDADDAPIFDPSDFDSSNLRRIFASLQEADSYAAEVPVPTIIFKRSVDKLYQVAVEYP